MDVEYGVTAGGFVPKGIDVLLTGAFARARAVFGEDVDLSPTSPLRKLLEVTASEDALLWRQLEDLYYRSHLSTAVGDGLDLLGEDIGVDREAGHAVGEVTLTVRQPQDGRSYQLPEGTILTGPAATMFHTIAPTTVTAESPTAVVAARAFTAGPNGDVPAGAITGVDPVYAQLNLALADPTIIAAKNQRPFTGGSVPEPDADYRARLLGRPRTLWTLSSVRTAVLDVAGVVDVLLSDPLGGVDVSQSYFSQFRFGQRTFSADRDAGEPYFFTVVVGHEFTHPWHTQGEVLGIADQVHTAVDRVRPVGVHPKIVEADHIEVGVRARIAVRAGFDAPALLAAGVEQAASDIGAGLLGTDVRYSQIMRAFAEQPGVIDVQDLHLRRHAPTFGRITFGSVPFQTDVVEAAAGENLAMGPTEIAVFRVDGDLIDLEVDRR